MFRPIHAEARGVFQFHGEGHVARHFHSPLFGLADDLQVGVAGNFTVVDLYKVDVYFLQAVERCRDLRGGDHGDGSGPYGVGSVELGAGGKDARSGELAGGGLFAPFQYRGGDIAAAFADGGDAIGEEEGQKRLVGLDGGVAAAEMDMHVPEAGHHVFTSGVVVFFRLVFCGELCVVDGFDGIIGDGEELVGDDLAGGDVDDVGVGDEEGVFP